MFGGESFHEILFSLHLRFILFEMVWEQESYKFDVALFLTPREYVVVRF